MRSLVLLIALASPAFADDLAPPTVRAVHERFRYIFDFPHWTMLDFSRQRGASRGELDAMTDTNEKRWDARLEAEARGRIYRFSGSIMRGAFATVQ